MFSPKEKDPIMNKSGKFTMNVAADEVEVTRGPTASNAGLLVVQSVIDNFDPV